jgi:hypothetical protein
MAEREGFSDCEYTDCTLCCREVHSALCYTGRGWKGKNYVRHSAMEPLALRIAFLGQIGQTKRKPPVCWQCSVGVIAAYINP